MPGILRFKDWSTFRDTLRPHRRWTFTAAPSEWDIEKGDYLYEKGAGDDLWDGVRFQVRRPQEDEEPEIVRGLEDWQAASLFGGECPPWPPTGQFLDRAWRLIYEEVIEQGASVALPFTQNAAKMLKDVLSEVEDEEVEPTADTDPRVRRVLPDGPVSWGTAFKAVESVDAVGVRSGDVVLYIGWNSAISLRAKYREQVRGTIHRLPRTDYQTLSEYVHALRYVEGTYKASVGGLRNYLSNGRAQNGRDDTSRVIIIRSYHAPVSEPIQAGSDDGAIFELVHQVGGRMPPGSCGVPTATGAPCGRETGGEPCWQHGGAS